MSGSAEAHLARVRFAREVTESFPDVSVEIPPGDPCVVVCHRGKPNILWPGDTITFRRMVDGEAVSAVTFTLENPDGIRRPQ